MNSEEAVTQREMNAYWKGYRDAEANEVAAIREGYKSEICANCDTVLLAHKHFINCNRDECPMKDGGPSVLERLMNASSPRTEKVEEGEDLGDVSTHLLDASGVRRAL